MTDYTPGQRRELDRAYTAIRRIVESDHRAERLLGEAYKLERRERLSTPLTQELLIESFLDGWHGKFDVADLFGLAQGCATAVILGAACAKCTADPHSHRLQTTEADLALLTGAKLVADEARNARHARRMASL